MRLILLVALGFIFYNGLGQTNSMSAAQDKKLFVYGGELNKPLLRYIASLTDKQNPRVCYLPTATGDNQNTILAWYSTCVEVAVRPYVLRTFANFSPGQKSFEEEILSYDAIIVSGGNTINLLGIWKAQGIDSVLRKAYDRGIVLAGGTAGSLCWFSGGYSVSRPGPLSIVNGLGFLNFSHCPHYNTEPDRKALYQQAVSNGTFQSGYGCDEEAGILFVNGKMNKSVSLNNKNNNYYISATSGKIKEELLPAEIIK